MLVLGLSCCFADLENDFIPGLPTWFYHDSAASLVRDGKVLAAVEEERLIRVKHTNKFSRRSARACLEQAGATFDDVDRIAFFFCEGHTDKELGLQYLQHPEVPVRYCRELIAEQLGKEFSRTVDPESIVFVPHHLSHAYSTYCQSGFDESLVLVIDGNGENDSISLFRASETGMEPLHAFPIKKSMGHLYLQSIELLGYKRFDEYKVMGLAPYGDPEVYEELFQGLYELLPDGDFSFDWGSVQPHFLAAGFEPRRRGEPFNQRHRDFASALQRTLERIVLHVVGHWRQATGLRSLCVAGGVGHNSTLNGTLLHSGLFDDMFVDPASHDAGASIGAALYVARQESPQTFRPSSVEHVYLGPEASPNGDVIGQLKSWSTLVEFERVEDITGVAAQLISDGAVIGWVQGRSEFGPRALGNRSILADPRPRSNQDRVNELIKLREAYRPFAPAILAERAADYLMLPATRTRFDFMSYVVQVRPEVRLLLGAVTHVDGTTRAQTVDRGHNERFWSLIYNFGQLTGVPVLLNTSFNNNAEPIVQTTTDAVRCFLTTGLDCLVIDDVLIRRRPQDWRNYLELPVTLPPTVSVRQNDNAVPDGRERSYEVRFTYTEGKSTGISAEMFAFLTDPAATLQEFAAHGAADRAEGLVAEARRLWQDRFVDFQPGLDAAV
ncbi:carbamoyltransferase C-terminal domain-containing protein [Streptomyces antimycoticus]|uniref:carbamoyltransferase family protein n=1 Tax=Streptomyces antimycoticus TaxID=68175 RepID=UPI003441C3EB